MCIRIFADSHNRNPGKNPFLAAKSEHGKFVFVPVVPYQRRGVRQSGMLPGVRFWFLADNGLKLISMYSRPFHIHEDDRLIMKKKDKAEVGNWLEHLEFISREIEYLIPLESRTPGNDLLSRALYAIRRENTLQMAALCRYENSMVNALECDNMECDAFYLNNHEKNRNTYIEHLRKYEALKSKVFARLLKGRGE
ncbi:hypothetical protein ED312_18805 [Sinomicrobium pectinilyticum]|uniref:Uncharacterized protein n=2 Tax=Sinomicrobium pectinilyticum TaxID=1084421 RepID=A0A3N0DZ80_SINP1|nr:hypothetical protein ED312_18805 [Sinomicrobium pectinilyticum]